MDERDGLRRRMAELEAERAAVAEHLARLEAERAERVPTPLELISNRLDGVARLKRVDGPRRLRLVLGVSAQRMGELLGIYGRAYSKGTVLMWERRERGERVPRKYVMSDRAAMAYRALIGDVVEIAGRGRYGVRVLGKRVWRVEIKRIVDRMERKGR